MKAVGAGTLMVLGAIITTCLGGAIFMSYWTWFIRDLFPLHDLTLVQSIGLVGTVRFLTWENIGRPYEEPKKEDKSSYSFIEKWLIAVCTYLAFWGIGWFVHLFL